MNLEALNFAIKYIAEENYLTILELHKLQSVCQNFAIPPNIIPKISTIPRRWMSQHQLPKHICYMIVGNCTIFINTKHFSIAS